MSVLALRPLLGNLSLRPFPHALLLRGSSVVTEGLGVPGEGMDQLGEETSSAASPLCRQGQQVCGLISLMAQNMTAIETKWGKPNNGGKPHALVLMHAPWRSSPGC